MRQQRLWSEEYLLCSIFISEYYHELVHEIRLYSAISLYSEKLVID